MRTLYIECNMGCAGDMLMAALYELIDDKAAFLDEMDGLIDGLAVTAEPSVKCGVTGTRMSVTIHGEEENEHMYEREHEHEHKHTHKHEHEHEHGHKHTHSDLRHVEHTIAGLSIPEAVKTDALAVYAILAEAEGFVHGKPVSEVHFHEVGTADAIADIAGVCLLMHRLNVRRVFCSPVNVGGGFVKCAHGVLPVPAPATARILRDMPIYGSEVKSELCTPTGAALLKHFVTAFGDMPAISVSATGYGMGKKDFPAANCVRAFLGEASEGADGRVAELACNLDDMDGEAVAFAAQALLGAGALDAFTTPIVMKKGRPAVMLTCLCETRRADEFAALMLKHTTTFGVRKAVKERYVLSRRVENAETAFGAVRVKRGDGHGVSKYKVEYEDLAEIAAANDMPLSELRRKIYAQLEAKK